MGMRALSTYFNKNIKNENYGYKSFTQTKTDRYGHESTVQIMLIRIIENEIYGYKSFTQIKTDRYGHESTVQVIKDKYWKPL